MYLYTCMYMRATPSEEKKLHVEKGESSTRREGKKLDRHV
jgi:hypothetical protein